MPNQTLAFGGLLAGGIMITHALSGKPLADVVAGKVHAIPDTKGVLAASTGNGVVSAPLAGAINSHAGYVNPFAHSTGAQAGRIDMGQDFSFAQGSPIGSIANSKYIGDSPNWYNGQPYHLFQFLDGPMKGKYWYGAEGIKLDSKITAGSTVAAGQSIGTFYGSNGIEMGFASSTPGRTLAQLEGNTGDASHGNSPEGIAFHKFLVSIGANPA